MGQTLSSLATDKHTESGGDVRYLWGVSEMQGWRISMEDAHTIDLQLDQTPDGNSFFAVYDGHGGASTARFAGENVHKRLVKEEAYRAENYEQALKRAFLGTDEDILANPSYTRDPSGCTAVAALITKDNQIYVANAGDSRSVLSVKGEAKPLSYDHKPQNELEKNRVVAAGGYIEYGRVNGNLALARAIGDFEYKKNYSLTPEKQIITADPDVIQHDLSDQDEFLVLACDGIWDCLTSQQVINVVRLQIAQGKELQDICESLCELCLAPDTTSGAGIGCDNMTVLLVALLNGKTKEQWYAMIKQRVESKYGYDTPDSIPQIYAKSRLLSFQARRQAQADRVEDEPNDQLSFLGGSRAGAIGKMLSAANGAIVYYHGGDDADHWSSGDDDDSGEEDFSARIHTEDDEEAPLGHDVTKSLREQLDELDRDDKEDADFKMDDADDDAFKEPFDSVIDLSPAEQDSAETRANGEPLQGEAPPPPKVLPNGDAKQHQLSSTPGGDAINPVVAAEGFLDGSEDPLKG
ncbi:PP2C-domain-containing protein [Auriscalpium vulgare]|uniref:PP2C-domain-containing protein n=1 Tax=Auriscalpium vulgare TaxID=40419 RepID=A0ACB8RKE6_9AGAM|nr:PP2C-domain-containing protein [Auriscalpium vulgare]